MILGFKTHINKRPTYFVEKILACWIAKYNSYTKKRHTIRRDENDRWKPGMKIQFATGVRTKSYNCFAESECISTQRIEIIPMEFHSNSFLSVSVDYKRLRNEEELLRFVKNDGFDSVEDFFKWFDKPGVYKLIHWTDLRY